MLPAIIAITMKGKVEPKTFWITFISAQTFCTLFVWVWDLYMDWGFLRGTKPGHKLLRDKLTYPKNFYYVCIVLNTLFRFWWVLPYILAKHENDVTAHLELYVQGAMEIEAVRRTLWSLIRIENESFNNFEQYRTIVAIPPMQTPK